MGTHVLALSRLPSPGSRGLGFLGEVWEVSSEEVALCEACDTSVLQTGHLLHFF